MPDFLLNWAAEIQPATLLKKRLRHRCFPVNLWKFLSKSTLQNTSARIPPCFVSFFEILVKKAFRMVLHYFRNSSCKLSLKIVWLSQSLSAYCYVKMQKFVHCHRQRRAPSKRCVPSINKRPPPIVDIFRKFYENSSCNQTISFCVTMFILCVSLI